MTQSEMLDSLFNTTYDGFRARRVADYPSAMRFSDFLRAKQVSFRLKIVRRPRVPAFYLFQLAQEV